MKIKHIAAFLEEYTALFFAQKAFFGNEIFLLPVGISYRE